MSSHSNGHEWIQVGCCGCGDIRNVPIYCGNRFCEVCTNGRRSKMRSRLQHMVRNIKLASGYEFRHLTLTIRSEQSLPLMVTHLISSFRKLRQTKFWKDNVSGGAYVIEITRGTIPGYWHAHIHAIIANRFFDVRKFFPLWRKASGSSSVHISKISRPRIITYLTKYVSKSELDQKDSYLASCALKGYRLFTPFGDWHKSAMGCPKIKLCCPKCGSTELQQLEFMSNQDRNYEITILRNLQYSRGHPSTSPEQSDKSSDPTYLDELKILYDQPVL